MPEKTTVTFPLTASQKNKIKKVTGRTISALKVEKSAGRTVVKTARIKLTRKFPPKGPYTIG